MSIPKRFYNVLRGYINREYERIQGVDLASAEQELRASLDEPLPMSMPKPAPPADQPTRARRILGVTDKASFGDVRKAYERLNRRSDPSNFPVGSLEARQAADVQKKVQWAYRVLSENVNITEQRFQSLEIE